MTPQNLMLLPLSTPKLSIGCPILDGYLGGGIPCNFITELYETIPAYLKHRSESSGGCHLPNGGFYWARSWNQWGEVGKLGNLHTSGRLLSPALGLAWAHCINSRVLLG
ncbi:hypothetical protein L3X38_003955 [Prunus dulcis]|uniref:Uncharacterized protein n=1 Tax=Prunus dulcis TaxID=3755 RepID=A0AAD5F2R2_PRUDU|nr:hypothetical protein L3X38_003955 [Prunus dulcis]